MWPLESMVALVRGVREAGVDAVDILGAPVGGLLAQVPGWDGMERAELHSALDAIVRDAQPL
jgi:hypothetical protein